MEIDSALSTVQTLKNELQDAKMAAVESQLKPLPGETVRHVRASQRVELLLSLYLFLGRVLFCFSEVGVSRPEFQTF